MRQKVYSGQVTASTPHIGALFVPPLATPTNASRKALAELCQTYWYPRYAYVRRRVVSVEEAQDLTQEFFSRFLERNDVAAADASKGKFRAFLLASLKHFLANEWKKHRAQKRGGGRAPLRLEFDVGESRYGLEPSDELTPDKVYERQWAVTLVNSVLARLGDEQEANGKRDQFETLKPFLTGSGAAKYAAAALRLGSSEGAVRVAVHRLRGRYRELIRHEISQTVSHPGEINWR